MEGCGPTESRLFFGIELLRAADGRIGVEAAGGPVGEGPLGRLARFSADLATQRVSDIQVG